jgi:hypothetical protein
VGAVQYLEVFSQKISGYKLYLLQGYKRGEKLPHKLHRKALRYPEARFGTLYSNPNNALKS